MRRFTATTKPGPVRVLLPQLRLQQLAGRCAGQLIEKDKIDRQPPFGKRSLTGIARRVLRGHSGARFGDHQCQGSFHPSWDVAQQLTRGFCNAMDGRRRHSLVDRAGIQPPAGLDQYLWCGPYPDAASLRINGDDVTGPQPTILGPAIVFSRQVEITGGDKRSLEFLSSPTVSPSQGTSTSSAMARISMKGDGRPCFARSSCSSRRAREFI